MKIINRQKRNTLSPSRIFIAFVTLMLSFNLKINAQQNEISEVKFTFRHSVRVENYFVTVELKNMEDSIEVHTISKPLLGGHEWEKSKRDFTLYISKAKFDDIISEIKKINRADIAAQKNFSGKDGNTCIIEFGNDKDMEIYTIWTPNNATKKRNLEAFLKTCKLLLKSGGLKPNEIF